MSNSIFTNLLKICPRCQIKRQLTCGRVSGVYRSATEFVSPARRLHDVSSSSGSDSEGESFHGDEAERSGRLYPGHIPTSLFQKVLLSAGAATVAITSPWRGDMVATLGETTGYFALVRMKQKMLEDETGRQILEEMPLIDTTTVDLDYLRSLPADTFGKTYVTWLDTNRASPDERDPVRFVDEPDLAYVMLRYRQVHDMFHAVLGMPTNMLGEVVVKWVEAVQLGLPMCALGALFGPVRLGPKHMQLYLQTHLWWAIRNARQAKFLMNIYYEKYWEWNLQDLRQELNIENPPKTPKKKS